MAAGKSSPNQSNSVELDGNKEYGSLRVKPGVRISLENRSKAANLSTKE